MPHLLFELGCEELPAGSVQRASEALAKAIADRLTALSVEFGAVHRFNTPRRLIVAVDEVSARQPDQKKEARGPMAKSAYDAEGHPTKALEGFLRGQGASLDEVRVENDYVYVTRNIPGRPTSEILTELLPEAVRSLTFDKTMRWGSGRMRFARPIRWILASFDGAHVPFEIEGVASGLESRGHRFKSPAAFTATDLAGLLAGLRERSVEPDPAVREKRVREQAVRVAETIGGVPTLTDALVDENVHLAEDPICHVGHFAEGFLELPEPVVVTAMAKHERFFPVRNAEGALVNAFVSVRNSGDEATVRAGNEWVLNARLNDARFFYDEDRTKTLDDFLAKTEAMAFQDKLGSVRQRADRLADLCALIATGTGANDEETGYAAQAGLYAKADLSTGLVGELASLQGVVGGYYARREGLADPVCWALQTQYDHARTLNPNCEGARTAQRLILADHLDKLAGFLGLGLAPSGSSDPFALRRAGAVLVEVAWNWDAVSDLSGWFRHALALYREQGFALDEPQATQVFGEVLNGRYELMLEQPYDAVQAALGSGDLMAPRLVKFRAQVAAALKSERALVTTLTRPVNIAKAAEQKGQMPDAPTFSKIDSVEGEELLAHAEKARLVLDQDLGHAVEQTLQALRALEGPTNRFFDSTMVMAEDSGVRASRLSVVRAVRDQVVRVADITQLVFEGEE